MIIFIVFLHLVLVATEEGDGASNLDENFQYPDVSKHKNVNLLPKDCGEKIENVDFPWLALLSFERRSGKKFPCGGSIINQNYILTAAHCVSNLHYNLTSIRVGAKNIETTTKSDEKNLIQDVSIEEIISHPEYDSKKHRNDIALVRVSPIDFSSKTIRSICLPLNQSSNFNYTNVEVKVTGWNSPQRNNTEITTTSLSYVPLATCQQKLSELHINIAQSQLCFSSSCLGVGGAPLHVVTPLYGDLVVQEGIVSFGPISCEKPQVPDVYTRVAFFMEWILDNMKP